MSLPIIYFLGLMTWGFHSHFIRVRYMTRGPIGRSIICFGSFLRFLLYNISPPYLCLPFFNGWYTYSMSHIRYGSCVFTVVLWIISNKAFNAVNEVCNLVSTRVGPFYITSSWLSYSWFGFSYFGCIGGIHIIHWIICDWIFSWGPWDNI
jgi:hypothetical protein